MWPTLSRIPVHPAGVCDFRAVFRASSRSGNARSPRQRCRIQSLPRDVHDQGFPPATSGNRRQVCPRIPERMERLPERSDPRARHDRQTKSGAQSRMDAVYVDAIAGRPFRRRRGPGGRATRPNGSKTLGHHVRTARRFESHWNTLRSHDGVHLAISSGTLGETGSFMVGTPEAHHEKSGYGLRRGALSPVETLAQSVSTISPTATPVATIPLVCALAGNGTWLAYILAIAAIFLLAC